LDGEWLCLDVVAPERLTLVEGGVVPADALRRLGIPSVKESGVTGGMTVVLKWTSERKDDTKPA
jgi:hypothetical protein